MKKRRALEEAYGVLLGLPFSNRVIDTLKMAENHLPDAERYHYRYLAEMLGIKADDCHGLEGNAGSSGSCTAAWIDPT